MKIHIKVIRFLFNNETQFNEINNDLTQKYAKSLRMKEIYEKNMSI